MIEIVKKIKKLKIIIHKIKQKTKAFFIKKTILIMIWIKYFIFNIYNSNGCNKSNCKDLDINDILLNNEITLTIIIIISNENNSYLFVEDEKICHYRIKKFNELFLDKMNKSNGKLNKLILFTFLSFFIFFWIIIIDI